MWVVNGQRVGRGNPNDGFIDLSYSEFRTFYRSVGIA